MENTGAKTMKTFVIALDNIAPGSAVYLAAAPQWDAAWQTREIAGARRYARKANAERVIRSYGPAWNGYNARVVEA